MFNITLLHIGICGCWNPCVSCMPPTNGAVVITGSPTDKKDEFLPQLHHCRCCSPLADKGIEPARKKAKGKRQKLTAGM